MGGGVDVGVHADVLKARFHTDDGAAAVVARHIEAAAGTHANDGGLALGDGLKGLNTGVKAGHQFIYLILKAKHGGDGGGIPPDALDDAQLGIGSQKDHGRDLAECVIAGGQASTDENNIRFAGHNRFQGGLLDGA